MVDCVAAAAIVAQIFVTADGALDQFVILRSFRSEAFHFAGDLDIFFDHPVHLGAFHDNIGDHGNRDTGRQGDHNQIGIGHAEGPNLGGPVDNRHADGYSCCRLSLGDTDNRSHHNHSAHEQNRGSEQMSRSGYACSVVVRQCPKEALQDSGPGTDHGCQRSDDAHQHTSQTAAVLQVCQRYVESGDVLDARIEVGGSGIGVDFTSGHHHSRRFLAGAEQELVTRLGIFVAIFDHHRSQQR